MSSYQYAGTGLRASTISDTSAAATANRQVDLSHSDGLFKKGTDDDADPCAFSGGGRPTGVLHVKVFSTELWYLFSNEEDDDVKDKYDNVSDTSDLPTLVGDSVTGAVHKINSHGYRYLTVYDPDGAKVKVTSLW